jgi:hypothetical protein
VHSLFWRPSFSEKGFLALETCQYVEQADGPNHHAFGTFGTSAAKQPLVPKASGGWSSGTLAQKNMPPTFAYIIAFMMYAVASAAVLVVAGGLAIFTSTRLIGIRIAAGTLFSLPGMLVFQVISFPFVLLTILIAAAFFAVLEPNNGMHVMIGISILLLSVALFAAGSAYGIYFGYRSAWLVCGGTPWKDALRSDAFVALLIRAWKTIQQKWLTSRLT